MGLKERATCSAGCRPGPRQVSLHARCASRQLSHLADGRVVVVVGGAEAHHLAQRDFAVLVPVPAGEGVGRV